jgi:glycosyltransferase involved in cell wall biosynthesis
MSTKNKIFKIAFSVTNCICYDQRVLKIADIVSKLDYNITIIGRRSGDCCDSDIVPFRTIRFNMIFKKGFLFYKFFNIRLFFHILLNNYDILVANDLDTLLPNFLVSKLKRIPLVYDSHEYFTGVPELTNRTFVRSVWETIERFIFPRLKYVLTVSEPIASLYEKLYFVKPLVIRNYSKNSEHILPFTRTELNVPIDDLIVIIQGAGINIDKGAEELVDAINIAEKVTLLIVGGGDVIGDLKNKVEQLNLTDKVRFIPKIPWDTLMRYTKAADVGMCLEKDTNINYRFSLANKLFDYISAGIPVVASDLQEVTRIVLGNNCGIIIPMVTPGEIIKAINGLKQNSFMLSELKKNAVKASKTINWESESLKVKDLYKVILDSL